MAAGFLARGKARLQQLFPERQLYHRSNGHVQFVVLTPRFQIVSVIVGLSVMGWVAYASVMTGFKANIVAAQDERIADLKARYEAQISQLHLDYDDISTKMALADQRFQSSVAAIEKREGDLKTAMADQGSAGAALNEIVRRADTVRALGIGPGGTPIPSEEDPSASGGEMETAPPATAKAAKPLVRHIPETLERLDRLARKQHKKHASAETLGRTQVAQTGLAPGQLIIWSDTPTSDVPVPISKPRTVAAVSLPTQIADAALSTALSSAPTAPPGKGDGSDFISSGRNLAAGSSLASIENRLESVSDAQKASAISIATAAVQKENKLRELMGIAGLDANAVAPRDDAEGGPFIPMSPDAASVDPLARDPNLVATDTTMKRIALLRSAMLSVPLANPLPAVMRISSGFGGRRDPFTGAYAFHSGLDFKGPYGSDIHATAPGVVTTAEWHGGYGQMVEIDHGYGLKTRYAHMSAISVVVGQKVEFGQKVGELGSTGRSTGPHLHYEVWFDGQARDPWIYLKAGADVLQRQGT